LTVVAIPVSAATELTGATATAGEAGRRLDAELMANLACSFGRHRWVWDEGDTVECFRCHKQKTVGQRLLCRFGVHHWVWVSKAGDAEPYRECCFCRKYGGAPTIPPGGMSPGGA